METRPGAGPRLKGRVLETRLDLSESTGCRVENPTRDVADGSSAPDGIENYLRNGLVMFYGCSRPFELGCNSPLRIGSISTNALAWPWF